MALDVVCLEQSMYPEAVEASLLDDDHIPRPCDELLGSPPQACQQAKQFGGITRGTRVFQHPLAV